jgi:hypothetical protein
MDTSRRRGRATTLSSRPAAVDRSPPGDGPEIRVRVYGVFSDVKVTDLAG